MLALLLGAGFAKWAVDLPVAAQLFDYAIELWGPRDGRRMAAVRSRKERWDEAHPDGVAEQFIADALEFPEKDRRAVLWYIGRRLSEPFIWKEFHAQRSRRQVLMIDENRRFDVSGVVTARTFIQQFRGPRLSGIVTTNYDMLVEYALGTKGFNYAVPGEVLTGRGPYPVSQWRNPVRLRGEIPLAKIHGSISWDENGCYTDGRRAITGGALIVPPTPQKEPPEVLSHVWTLAGRILERADSLLVFGSAFNPYDEAVLKLLQRAGRKLKSVLLVDIDPKTHAARDLWPVAKVTSCLPPPSGDRCIECWWDSAKRQSPRPTLQDWIRALHPDP
jgi:hypothetical protein